MSANNSSPRQMAGHINDACGRTVTQTDPVALYLLRQHHVIDADTLQVIANAVSGDIRDAPYAKSAGLLYLCSLPWIIWYGIKRKRFGNVAAAMLRHRRCPHCGYDLRLLPTDPSDGATVCPECGCAWKLNDGRDGGGRGDD